MSDRPCYEVNIKSFVLSYFVGAYPADYNCLSCAADRPLATTNLTGDPMHFFHSLNLSTTP